MDIDSDSDASDLESVMMSLEDNSEASEDEDCAEEEFVRKLQRIKDNDPYLTKLDGDGEYEFIQNITNEQWHEIGRLISNNTHLKKLRIYDGALNDEKASFLFRGMTRSSSIMKLQLDDNGISAEGVWSIVPFSQRAKNLRTLYLSGNNIQSDGFNVLCRAMRDSPIEELQCNSSGIESIEIDINYFPRSLKHLHLASNSINADGCREIAKLLQRGHATLKDLNLCQNHIDDEGIATLVDALQNNTSLELLLLIDNNDISLRGRMLLLKLVNDISSVKATLQSNHTLKDIFLTLETIVAIALRLQHSKEDEEIQRQINMATNINKDHVGNPEAAGREKVIQTQLHSARRAELAELQGVNNSVHSEINPLHLPEVLSLVGRKHGRGELYIALKSLIAGVISLVNERQCIMQQLTHHELHAELAQFDAAGRERDAMHVLGNEVRSNKRRRNHRGGVAICSLQLLS